MKTQKYAMLTLALLALASSIGVQAQGAMTVYQPGSSPARYGNEWENEGSAEYGSQPVSMYPGDVGMYPAMHGRSEERRESRQEPLLMYPGDVGMYPGLRSRTAASEEERRERRRRHHHGRDWRKRKGHGKAWGWYKKGYGQRQNPPYRSSQGAQGQEE